MWDLVEQKCIQTLKIKFPCFGVEGKEVEWGRECVFPGPKRYDGSDMVVDENNIKKCFNIDNITERKQTVDTQLKG